MGGVDRHLQRQQAADRQWTYMLNVWKETGMHGCMHYEDVKFVYWILNQKRRFLDGIEDPEDPNIVVFFGIRDKIERQSIP